MRYVITGRVHPERADVSFSRIEMGLPEGGRAVLSCTSSQVTVALDFPDLDGWITAMVRAEDVASIVVGALGFSLGTGYSLELIQVTEQDGTPHVLGARPPNPKGAGDLAFRPHNDIFNRTLSLAAKDVFFRLAVRDYVRAINEIGDCASYCYRAVESIKSAFVFKTGNDRWDDMHATLGTHRASIKATIKDYADPVRHGNWISARPTDKIIRWHMLEMTRKVLIKYLDVEAPQLLEWVAQKQDSP